MNFAGYFNDILRWIKELFKKIFIKERYNFSQVMVRKACNALVYKTLDKVDTISDNVCMKYNDSLTIVCVDKKKSGRTQQKSLSIGMLKTFQAFLYFALPCFKYS